MKNIILITILLLSLPVKAINVGSVTTYIFSNTDSTHQLIKNNTDEARLISISIEEISTPDSQGVVIDNHPRDILLTPSTIIMPAQSESNIRFFYQGSSDTKERYYRIYWKDSNLSTTSDSQSERNALASATAVVGTILVVNPRIENFSYQYKDNILENTGNTSYRVVAYGPCLADSLSSCKENYNDLPGKKREFKFVDMSKSNSFIGIWNKHKYINVK